MSLEHLKVNQKIFRMYLLKPEDILYVSKRGIKTDTKKLSTEVSRINFYTA